ncbi:McKusick-Kaufman/Bardet-Biedl syndromes putative chaperonin [Frankliniella fusca]|uniref:McKusick-Kaufman/Bardet-Biedl syndromes putative chaperonin n=1 Tax=Frankliniella fusca TaxID=407009 RepID=A0AAE1H8E4_9NEOP|nr:McKusick-Kaufman/Bardet-Biedl syndromes putative chaperonin [Frankliniella fusca]
MSQSRIRRFLSSQTAMVAMCVGYLALLHYGWQKLQYSPVVNGGRPPATLTVEKVKNAFLDYEIPKMSLVLVSSFQLKPSLDDLCKLFAASVGPNGCFCLLMSSADSLTLSSLSSRIIPNLPLDNPILQFIQQCIGSQNKKYHNGGFYCGILLTKLLTRILESSLPRPLACCILNEFSSIMQDAILNSPLHIAVNLDSVHPFMAVAQSILLSKCGLHKQENSETLSRNQVSLIVQAFLQSEASVDKVFINVVENSDKQFLHKGILYECTEGESVVLDGKVWRNVSILLFSVMLTDQIDCKEGDLPNIAFPDKGKLQFEISQLFIEKAISLGIKVIACQKVIHPELLLKLRRKGILAVQRLGKRLTDALEKISGAIPISSLETPLLDRLPKLKGFLASVQYFEEVNNNTIGLEGNYDCNVCSLQLTSRTLGRGPDLKVISHQILVALSHVLQDAAVCPGAGCSEVYLITLLWKKIQSEKESLCKKLLCSLSQLNSVMMWLQEGLLQAAGLTFSSGKLAVDSVYHHAWKGSDSKIAVVDASSCNCGLITSYQVESYKGFWSFLTVDHMRQWVSLNNVNVQSPPLVSSLMRNNCVVDVCTIKKSALGLAVDSCIAISNIGAVIVKKT